MKKLVAVLLTFLLILTGCNTVEVTKVKDDIKTDNIKFHSEYSSVPKNNIYEYATYVDVTDKLKKGTGIIYFGFPSCSLCKEITPLLNEVSKEKNVKKILYYNFKDIRDDKTDEYKKLTELLSDFIEVDDEGNKRLVAPTIVYVNKGNITDVYIGKITTDSEEILTEEDKNNLKSTFESYIDKMNTYKTTTNEETKKDS